jgi:hypothetical protein
VSPRAGPPPAGRARRGGGDVATLVREDRHRLLGSLPLQRARSCATGNGGSSSDLWGAHPRLFGLSFLERNYTGSKSLREHTTALLAPQERQLDNARLSAAASASFGQSRKPEEKAKFAQERRRAPQKIRTKMKVFICYCREDSAGYAGRIKDRLDREFGSQLPVHGRGSHPLGKILSKYCRRRSPSATHCSFRCLTNSRVDLAPR